MTGCNKIRSESRGEANAWAREAKAKSRTSGNLRSYRCPACGCWHLTSRYTARDERRIARARRKAA